MGGLSHAFLLVTVTLIYNKGCKKDQGNYRPVSLILVTGKVVEQILSETTWNVQDNQGIRPASMGFCKAGPASPTLSSMVE